MVSHGADSDLITQAVDQDQVVVSTDSDFRDSHLDAPLSPHARRLY